MMFSSRRVHCVAKCVMIVMFTSSDICAFQPASPVAPHETRMNLTRLPIGVSPLEKSQGVDIQGNLRKLAAPALSKALKDDLNLLEIDFPPLLPAKSAYDDFDNISELNANRDWLFQFIPLTSVPSWSILPDDKECELAVQEWGQSQYVRKLTRFTSIRAALVATGVEPVKAWGSTIASTFNRLTGGDGILADTSALDDLNEVQKDTICFLCQPGNGGPVEDWINIEKLHKESKMTTCIINGALDKVRDGYYPSLAFPALAATIPFYERFEAVLVLRPVADKGIYGWLFRVYPEDWQVMWQKPTTKGDTTTVDNVVVMTSKQRPSYSDCVKALLAAASNL